MAGPKPRSPAPDPPKLSGVVIDGANVIASSRFRPIQRLDLVEAWCQAWRADLPVQVFVDYTTAMRCQRPDQATLRARCGAGCEQMRAELREIKAKLMIVSENVLSQLRNRSAATAVAAPGSHGEAVGAVCSTQVSCEAAEGSWQSGDGEPAIDGPFGDGECCYVSCDTCPGGSVQDAACPIVGGNTWNRCSARSEVRAPGSVPPVAARSVVDGWLRSLALPCAARGRRARERASLARSPPARRPPSLSPWSRCATSRLSTPSGKSRRNTAVESSSGAM